MQPEKAAARAWNSVQCDSDGQSLREYRQEVGRLLAGTSVAAAANATPAKAAPAKTAPAKK